MIPIKFLTIIAWVLGIVYTAGFLFILLQGLTYTKLDKLIDELHGQRKIFQIRGKFIVALLCWAFLIAKCSMG
jgi:hypothetical protein